MNRVREFRQQQQLSQLALSRQVDVARQTINLIENDKYNPTLSLCLRLAWALHTNLDELFWEDEPK